LATSLRPQQRDDLPLLAERRDQFLADALRRLSA